MSNIAKTIFLSYRRATPYHARLIHTELKNRGYDVFMDVESMDSGAFARIILREIEARAHFLVILTPSALDRCTEPDDWLRTEIEHALDYKRNIVPLMFDGFSFNSMKDKLTG